VARILLVEDETGLREVLTAHLEADGHRVRAVPDGKEAIREAARFLPELVVLDWMLPGMDGLAVCRELRRHHLMPVIMLTARSEEVDRVTGLEVGADDYVVKPFSVAELVARVRAQLRRVAIAVSPEPGTLVVSGPLVVDVASGRATIGGGALDLSRRELELLALLVSSPGRTFTRDYLLDRLWGPDYEGLDRAVDTQVARLRRKLGPLGAWPGWSPIGSGSAGRTWSRST
jgi:DNA-binding response OmpR family regulator